MITSADILARVRQRPFVPLRLSTSAGESFDITHPDLVLVGRRDVTFGIADPVCDHLTPWTAELMCCEQG